VSLFEQVGASDLDRLIDQIPLAWIVPHAAPETALMMPLVRDGEGRLLGHLPRRHPAVATLTAQGHAQLLFLGPNAYVSTATAGRDDWAPTWNFASARLAVDIVIDESLTAPALAKTVAHLETEWTTERLGPRYAELAARVIGFSATVRSAHPRFKLGQDERPEVREQIAKHFAGTPLGDWLAEAARTG